MNTVAANPRVEAVPPPAMLQTEDEQLSKMIELSRIVPSQTNPGRGFDPERDSDLVDSIRTHKVVQPVILRTSGVEGCSFTIAGKFEIVAGERRYHCSIKAGKTHIPAMVFQLTDAQALEFQFLENDQREDLDPMSKAAALRRVWDAYEREGADAQARMAKMIERANRKARTVWNLLSLGKLIERGQKALSDGDISMSHAYEIARRPRSAQNRILNWYMEEVEYGKISVRNLKEWIRDNCDRFLDGAPFDRSDPLLLKEAGACDACDKNTAVNPNLVDIEEFKAKGNARTKPAKVKAICTDGECWQKKVEARVERAVRESGPNVVRVSSTQYNVPKGAKPLHEWREARPDSCLWVAPAVVVDGDTPGKKLSVCTMTNLCKTHFPGASSSSSRRVSSGGGRKRSESEKREMLLKQRNKKADQAYRTAACSAFRNGVKDLKHADLQEVAAILYQRLDYRLRNPICKIMGWSLPEKQIQGLKPAELAGCIALLAIADNILPGVDYVTYRSVVKPAGFADRHKIDLKKIEAEATAALRARWKQIDAAKSKDKPKSGNAKSGKGHSLQTSAAKRKGAAA